MKYGIDLGGTKIELIALSPEGNEVYRERVSTPKQNYEGTVRAIKDLIHRADEKTGSKGSIGMGHPGAISPKTGLIKNANSTWLNGKPFKEDLEQALGRPFRMTNDANCLALSEAVDGAGKDAASVFAVIVGTGCGAGIAINKHVIDGPNGIAGEWGHNPLPFREGNEPELPCYCGKHGCIETFLSGTGFQKHYYLLSGDMLSSKEIALRAEAGDSLAEKAFSFYERAMAKALASIINILDPEVIVLGGGMSNVSRIYKNVPALLETWVFGKEVNTKLLPNVHGDSSGVRGAAWLWD
jgi:fructokinase